MKNADSANLWIVDQELRQKAELEGVEILSSSEAWQQYQWTRQYFEKKPDSGYFIWVKDQPPCALTSCVNIQKAKTKQQLDNLVVVEAGITAKLQGTCSALSLKLQGVHQAQGKIVLRKKAQVEYQHFHTWGKKDVVAPNYLFILEKGSQLNYTYKITKCPEKLSLENRFEVHEQAKVKLNIFADCSHTQFESLDEIKLLGKDASGISNLRFISRDQAKIKAVSRMIAQAPAAGHLDCQSLNLAESAQVNLIPELTVEHDQAQITHEASIGKVSPEQLNYLRMRGLSEEQAIDLIAAGFLKI